MRLPLSPETRIAIAVLLAATLSCGPKQKTDTNVEPPPVAADAGVEPAEAGIKAEPIPTQVTSSRVEPMAGHTPRAASPLLAVMASENKRWIDVLATKPAAERAYFLGYQIHDRRIVVIEADGGALITDNDETDRFLDVEVRVGSPAMDNRHQIHDPKGHNHTLNRQNYAPFGSDDQAIRTALWLETDRRYRESAVQYGYVVLDETSAKSKQTAPDFVHEPAEVFIQPVAQLTFDKSYWVDTVRNCSKKALKGMATRATCSVLFELNTMYMVNSEGSRIQMSWPTTRIAVSVGVKADDGAPLSRLEQRFAPTPDLLPGKDEIARMIDKVTGELDALHKAPVVDPYVGPAILEGRAAGVFFHEVFGHRIEGHRQKDKTSGRTFSTKVGERIMPEWMKVYDDPTLTVINNIYLNGFYHYDDEAVRARRVDLVTDGVLKGFVLGRNPIDGFAQSNGHGRKQLGQEAVSRQGNMVVEAAQTVEDAKLYEQLIAEVKAQGKKYGMVFTDISGGFTNTSSFAPQSFKVHPTMAYRVYPDGRKELVRGIDIVGTPLTALGSIILAGRTVQTFNGTCGAESGWVPVSATAPSLLIKQIEVERVPQPRDISQVLPPPPSIGGSR